jgi:hypothetical protein
MDKKEKDNMIDLLTYNNHNNNLIKFNNSLKDLCMELKIISDKINNIYHVKKGYIGKDIHLKGAELSRYINYDEDKLYGENTHLIFLNLILNNI